jgi:hypothetical protein
MPKKSKGRRKPRGHRRAGHQLKSALEAYCYDRLRDTKLKFSYEGEVFYLMDGFRYDGVYHKMTKGKDVMTDRTGKAVLGIKYTPDFVSHEHKFIIETKGYVHGQHTFPLRWKLFLRYLVENGMSDYMLFIPKNRKQVDETIRLILNELGRA